MKKNPYIVPLFVGLVAILVALAFMMTGSFSPPPESITTPATSSVSPTQPQNEEWGSYSSARYGWSIDYPTGTNPNEKYVYTSLGEGKEVSGISFAFPQKFYQGTNLSNDTSVIVLRKDNLAVCTPEAFTLEPVEQTAHVTVSGISWSMIKTSGAGAGNFYEETSYTTGDPHACYNVRLFLHSTNIGNYPPGVVTAFDRSGVETIFAHMLQSFAPTSAGEGRPTGGLRTKDYVPSLSPGGTPDTRL